MIIRKLNVLFACVFLISLTNVVVATWPDRAFMTEVASVTGPTHSEYRSNMEDIKRKLFSEYSPYFYGGTMQYVTDSDFLATLHNENINLMFLAAHGEIHDPCWLPWESCPRTIFNFDSGTYLEPSEVINDQNIEAGDFMYAFACSSAERSDMRDAFLEKGYGAYMGFVDAPLMVESSIFSKKFFEYVIDEGYSIERARQKACWDDGLCDLWDWDPHPEIYGDENLFIGDSPYSVDISLDSGWNMISLPLIPDNTDIEVVLSSIEGNYYSVMTYNPDRGWLTYLSGEPGNGLTEIEMGIGYWIYMNSNDILTITGTLPSSTTTPVYVGWNLAGYPSVYTRPVADALSSIEGNYNSVSTYFQGGWLTYIPGEPVNDLTEIKSGMGYWVDMKSNDNLVISA